MTDFWDLPPRSWEPTEVPGLPSQTVPDEPEREGLWIIVRDDDGEVTRIWDAPEPGLLH